MFIGRKQYKRAKKLRETVEKIQTIVERKKKLPSRLTCFIG